MTNAIGTTPSPLAIVTGASSGIGAATAGRLARTKRFRLLLAGRNRERLEEIVSQCRQASSDDVQACFGDLAEPVHIDTILSTARGLAPVGVLVNCAGLGAFGPAETYKNETFAHILAINITAMFALCKGVVPFFKEAGSGGTIVNISSDAVHSASECVPSLRGASTPASTTSNLGCDRAH
jgi:short-subunit dehydrogenase